MCAFVVSCETFARALEMFVPHKVANAFDLKGLMFLRRMMLCWSDALQGTYLPSSLPQQTCVAVHDVPTCAIAFPAAASIWGGNGVLDSGSGQGDTPW